MKINISQVIPADRARVFAACPEPSIRPRATPGCDTMSEAGPASGDPSLHFGIAGLKGTYSGKATIRDKHPPDSLTLTFEGKGTPGFVRGSAAITLADADGSTRVDAVADVQVGGLIAAVGSRLIEATARKLADDFFRQVSQQLTTT